MHFLKENPMLRLLIPFIIGITGFSYVQIDLTHLVILASFFFLAAILFEVMPKSHVWSYKLRFLPGLLCFAFMVLAGYSLMSLNSPSTNHYFFGHQEKDDATYLLIRIDELWSERPNSYRSTAQVLSGISSEGDQKPLKGKVMLYVHKSEEEKLPKPGQLIIANNQVGDISAPSNPHAFDYKAYLAGEGIYHQLFLRSGNWQSLKHEETGILHRIVRLRGYLLSQLEEHISDQESLAVASALLLGYRDYIPPDLRQAYAGSGAMHILAVSGLHVGIIFLVFKLLTKPLLKLPRGKFLQAFVIISLIWVFACLTGLAPSVRRASTMFTMITLGLIFFNKTSIYNIIGGSAFLLLLISPNLIQAIGFQLSYGAVIAIIAIQPKLYQLLSFENYLLDKGWALLTVSFAAQLGTAPLTLFYFNIFPNYFLLTNLIVIPAATLILYTGMLFFVVHSLMEFGKIVGWLLEGIIYCLNFSIHTIQTFPYAVSENILILHWEKYLMFFMVVCFFQFLTGSYKRSVIRLFVLLVVMQAGRLAWDYTGNETSYLRVYDSNNETWIEKRYGRKSLLLKSNVSDDQTFQFNVQPAIFKSGVKNVKHLQLNEENLFFRFNGSKVLYIDSNFVHLLPDLIELPESNLLIVSDVNRLPLNHLIDSTGAERVIFASNFSYYRSLRWQEICEKEGWECYFAAISGAVTYYPDQNFIEVFNDN